MNVLIAIQQGKTPTSAHGFASAKHTNVQLSPNGRQPSLDVVTDFRIDWMCDTHA